MPIWGIIADDLTGATTIGSLLAHSSIRAAVVMDCQSKSLPELDAIILSTESRACSDECAYNAVTDAISRLNSYGVSYYAKRIDSTLRGNIGVEINAMMDYLPLDCTAIVVPAFPQTKKIVIHGKSIIDGVPLSLSPASKDIRSPICEDDVVNLIRTQSHRRVGLLDYRFVSQGVKRIAKELHVLREEGIHIIVVDAISTVDVRSIAQACRLLQGHFLSVDPGPFTLELVLNSVPRLSMTCFLPSDFGYSMQGKHSKTVLAISGSVSTQTMHQISNFCGCPENRQIAVNTLNIINNEMRLQEIDNVTKKALFYIHRIPAPRTLIIESYSHIILRNESCLLSEHTAELILSALGQISKEILENSCRQIAGLYCTGGDTSASVCNSLGTEFIYMQDYIKPQIDKGLLCAGNFFIPIAFKGGLTGSVTAIHEIVNSLLTVR